MTNEELLSQIAEMFADQAKVLDEQFNSINHKFNAIDERFKSIDERFLSLEVTIENDVTKRIDALFDGYKLNHEKQWELERKVEALEKRIERLEIAG